MHNSLLFERLPAVSAPHDGIVVATGFDHPERGATRCPAAGLLAAHLRAEGLPVRAGRVRLGRTAAGQASATMFAVSYVDRDGTATGLGVTVPDTDPAAAAAAEAAVGRWVRAMRTRRVLIADAGVRCSGAARALELAERTLPGSAGPLYVLGAHSADEGARRRLAEQGAVFADDVGDVPDGATVVIPAHGAAAGVLDAARARGLRVVDGTCPLAAGAYTAVRDFAARGDHVAVIGRRGHAVTQELLSHGGPSAVLVENVDDVDALPAAAESRISFVPAPGMLIEDVTAVASALRTRFSHLPGQHPDQWCYAATDRADTLRSVADSSDVLLVLGEPEGADAETVAAQVRGRRAVVHRIRTLSQLSPYWLSVAATVGVVPTATAAPGLADAVVHALCGLGPASVVRRRATTETRGAAAVIRRRRQARRAWAHA